MMCKKKIHYLCEDGIEKPLMIYVCHHSASLMMPIGDPRDRFFYPTLTLMVDPYGLTTSEQGHEIFQYCGMCDQQSLRLASAYMHSLIRAFASHWNIL